MVTNIMQQYIKNTKNFLKNFTILFLQDKYIEKISNELINAYIEARMYNYGDNEHTFFYKRIQSNIDKKKEELSEIVKQKELHILDLNVDMYQFIFYIDGVREINDIDEFVSQMCKKREEDFNLKNKGGLEKNFGKQIKDFKEQKIRFIKKFYTQDFELIIEKYINIENAYKADLQHCFKLPYIYSDQIIDEVYNEGTINEDKLIIEYMLITAECIKDIEKGMFEKKYLANFARSLFEKEKKIKQALRVIDNQAIQDKVILKIYYEDFQKYRDIIYDLIQDGFKFAIIIDDTFQVLENNLRKLNIFNYMLVNPNSKNYEKIKNKENVINNTIIYDV